MTVLDFLGLWLIGSIPAGLVVALSGIAVYFLAKRISPAAGALSALLSLVLLSVVPILALAPVPKWWTLKWTTPSSIPFRGDAGDSIGFEPPISEVSASAQDSSNGFAYAIPTAQSPSGANQPQEEIQSETSANSQAETALERSNHVPPIWSIDSDQATRWIGIVLIVGWCLAIARLVLGLLAVRRLRQKSQQITDPLAINLAESIAKRLGFLGPVRLRTSPELTSAATVGWLHPEILLAANWQTWNHDELRAVLAHEIGHVARRDFAAWVLAQFSLTLHFYHPLAHWLISRLRRDQELAADLLGAELCGGREKYLVTLSQMVLTQTSRSAPLLARPFFFARGTFLWRMKMLNAKDFTAHARLKRWHIALLALVSILIGLGSARMGIAIAQAQPQESAKESPQEAPKAPIKTPASTGEKGLLKGRITAADTGKPVEGVVVRVLVEGNRATRDILELITDKEGQYSHEIPLGEMRLFGVYCPPGYYTQDERTFQSTTASKSNSTVVRDFSLQTGKRWALELSGYAATAEKPPIFSAQIDPNRTLFRSAEGIYTHANRKGEGAVTIPAAGGHYQFRCMQRETPNQLEIAPIDLKIENGFDPTQVQADPEINPTDQSVRLTDKAGKRATVSGAKVVLRSGSAVLQFSCKVIPKSAGFKAQGVVRDGWLKPIAGAKITAALVTDRGGGMSRFETYSEENGKFTIPEVLLPPGYFNKDQRIKMVVTKSGYNGEESKELSLTDIQKSGMADFGNIMLKPGVTLKGKVIDNQLKPVQGAVVTYMGRGFAHSHLAARTDAEGKFQMPDLNYGQMRMWINYGDQYGDDQFHFSEKSGEVILLLRYNRKD